VAAEPPEEIVKAKRSYTGAFLAPVLARSRRAGSTSASRRRSSRRLKLVLAIALQNFRNATRIDSQLGCDFRTVQVSGRR
jgi:hypothetical protein